MYGKITYTNTIYLTIENDKCEDGPIYRILIVIYSGENKKTFMISDQN